MKEWCCSILTESLTTRVLITIDPLKELNFYADSKYVMLIKFIVTKLLAWENLPNFEKKEGNTSRKPYSRGFKFWGSVEVLGYKNVEFCTFCKKKDRECGFICLFVFLFVYFVFLKDDLIEPAVLEDRERGHLIGNKNF